MRLDQVEAHLAGSSPLAREVCVLPREGQALAGATVVIVPEPATLAEQKTPLLLKRMYEVAEVGTASYVEPFRPDRVIVPEGPLARTPAGELDREAIAALAARWPEQPATLQPTHPAALRFLERLGEVLSVPGPYAPQQHFEVDLALDSLDLVQLRALLADEFGVTVTDEELWQLQRVEDALRLVEAAAGAGPTEPPKPTEPPEPAPDYTWAKRLREPAQVPLDERFTMNRRGFRRLMASLGMYLLRILATVFFRLRVRHTERLPKDGPFLLCPTHLSLLDSPLVYAAFPNAVVHKTVFIAYGPYFHTGPLSLLVRPGRLILTGEADNVGDSMRLAFDALQRGWNVVVFPEGRCSYDGEIMDVFPGVGLLAAEAQVPVVPVLYEGSSGVCSPRHPGLGAPKIKITVGEPLPPPTGTSREDYQGMAERWREVVLAMRAESLSGGE